MSPNLKFSFNCIASDEWITIQKGKACKLRILNKDFKNMTLSHWEHCSFGDRTDRTTVLFLGPLPLHYLRSKIMNVDNRSCPAGQFLNVYICCSWRNSKNERKSEINIKMSVTGSYSADVKESLWTFNLISGKL